MWPTHTTVRLSLPTCLIETGRSQRWPTGQSRRLNDMKCENSREILGTDYISYMLDNSTLNVNVNVPVYSLISPFSSADFTIYTPGICTLSYTVSSPLRRIQHLCTLLQL